MTDVATLETEDQVRDEIVSLGGAIRQLGRPNAPNRFELEQRVERLCTAATNLPTGQAHAIAEELVKLIQAFDEMAKTLEEAKQIAEKSMTERSTARAAASAYGAAQTRLKRGF